MFEHVIVVMDVKPTPKAEKRILELVKENKCLCGCGKPQWKRGLARTCYYAWQNARSKFTTNQERNAFDARLVRRGLLLLAQMVRLYKSKNVFDKVAKEKIAS